MSGEAGEPRTQSPRPADLTVAIPLHGGRRWLDGIRHNLSLVPDRAEVLISDASGLDDAAPVLAAEYAHDARVRVLVRDHQLDWIDHMNLLLSESVATYFCWLPQDDLVGPGGGEYFELLLAALDEDPAAVLAFPAVWRRITSGRLNRRPAGELPYRPPPFPLGRDSPQDEAVALLARWNLGFAWRGIFRRSAARPIPRTRTSADAIWTYSMALSGHLVEVPEAKYLKRFHPGSAHLTMEAESLAVMQAAYRAEVLARTDPGPERQRILGRTRRAVLRSHLRQKTSGMRRAAGLVIDHPRAQVEPEPRT